MIGIAKTFTRRTLRMAMGALALIGVAAAVPASAHPWYGHDRYDRWHHEELRGYGWRHDEPRGWGYGYGWHRHDYRPWHYDHERWR